MKARRWRSNQVQGLYVHSSPPSEVAPNPSVIRQWLRGGEVDKLEAVVIQGLGHKLLGEYASDLKVRAFLKTVPSYLARIDMLHEAAAKGNLKDLQTLLKPSSDGAFTRKKLSALALSKDPSGSGLMHKAVYHGHRDMVKWLADHHPGTVKVRDREGRSPLHYCGRAPDPEWTWTALRQAGADAALLDARGRPPQHYMDHPEDAELPSTPSTVSPGRFTSGNNGLVVKPSNIRIWIHDRDLGRLAQVVWEGYGEKLRTETSQHAQVKTFLSAVPYMMGVIKDTHTAAINNDIILLRKRTEPPVPRQIVLAKDQNGLTPLHKAAGLGHVEMVRALLSACAEAVGVLDREGRAPLHHAAAARGSGATYDLLLEYGADENIMDKKGKAPSYYINNAKEIDHKQLTVIPEATRTSTVFPANWDWGGLRLDWLGAKAPKPTPPPPPNNGDSAFEDETPERNSSQGNEINNNSVKEPPTRPQTYDIDAEADEGMEEEEEEDKERGYIADSDEQEGHYEAEYEEVDPDYEVMNEPTTRGEGDTLGEVESPGENQEAEGERARGVEEKEEEEEEEEQSDGRESSADRHARLQRVVEVGSMEQLAEVVLTGDGELLARHRSSNPDVQLFIDNIPTYLRKIEKVHTATRHGNLRELQAALDRRKFAVARESKSTLRLSPLHVAVLYGRTAVVRFLASRFPETMKVGDSKGRTPLHYAATLNDNGHYYNLLADLGADTSLEDADGKTAEIYLHQPSHITHEQLLAEFEGRQLSENSQTSDKVDSDSFSARRDNDDVEIMAALDRCFKLILNPSYKTASVSLLGQFMTQQLFECYRKLLTKSDHSLLDVIRPGVKQIAERSFPMDESPIVLPDYESFVVFFDFVTPIILGLNSFQPYVDLIPHPQSNFESEVGEINLENINLDPSNKIILSSIIECSRNLKGVNFPCSLTLKALEEVELEVSSTLLKFYRNKEADKISIMREEYDIDDMNGVYCTVSEILENENEIHNQLESQLLLDPELKRERRRGRHWPYGRGVYIRPEIYLAVWINVQEHIKIRLSVGDKDKGRIGLMFTRLGELVTHLEEHFEFEQHETLGYLATDPQFVGNGLKFHVVLSLPFLGSDFYDLQQLCYVRGLSVELMPKRSEFHLKNRQSLGLSEIQSFKEFSSAVSNIIELEKSKSRDNSSKMSQLLKNFIKKGK